MADILVTNATTSSHEFSVSGASSRLLVEVSSSVHYFFFRNATGAALNYVKSTDGGQTWGSPVEVFASTAGIAIWFDKWTAGDNGTKIWVLGITASVFRIRSLDTSSDTLSSIVNIASSLGTAASNDGSVHLTKSRGGNLYAGYSMNAGAQEGFYRSTDGGTNWTSRAIPYEASVADGVHGKLLPANLADSNDLWMLYGDASADEWSIKTYDDSANSWSEQAITFACIIDDLNCRRQCDAAIRHSDGHLIAVIMSAIDSSTADLAVFDYDGTTITRKTDITTNIDDMACSVIYINQNNDELFVGWLGDPTGTDAWQATVRPWYVRSTDGGTTWGTKTLYSEGAAADFRGLWCSHSTPGDAAGRFLLAWFDDDALTVTTNYANSVATGSAPVTGSLIKTLAAATLSSAGTLALTGALAKTTGAATLSSAAKLALEAALDESLEPATLSATGELPIEGSVANNLAAASLESVGALGIAASLAQTLASAILAATGEEPEPEALMGAVALLLAPASLVSAGTIQLKASVAKTLAPVTLSSAARVRIVGSVGVTLIGATGAAAGERPVNPWELGIPVVTAVALAPWIQAVANQDTVVAAALNNYVIART